MYRLYTSLIEAVQDQLSTIEYQLFLDAIHWAMKAHEGQVRKSGEPYATHVIAVAEALWGQYHDYELSIAGLLHDAVEDSPDISMQDVYDHFGDDIGFLVDGVTKHVSGFLKVEDRFDDKIERMLWAGTKDVRVLLLKLADRKHNMSTLSAMPRHKQVRISFETQAIFEPIATILMDANSIEECQKKYNEFISTRTPGNLKQELISQTFADFTTETFNALYGRSDSIIWKMNDLDSFKMLCKNSEFQDALSNVNFFHEPGGRYVLFTFKNGYTIDHNAAPLSFTSFKR